MIWIFFFSCIFLVFFSWYWIVFEGLQRPFILSLHSCFQVWSFNLKLLSIKSHKDTKYNTLRAKCSDLKKQTVAASFWCIQKSKSYCLTGNNHSALRSTAADPSTIQKNSETMKTKFLKVTFYQIQLSLQLNSNQAWCFPDINTDFDRSNFKGPSAFLSLSLSSKMPLSCLSEWRRLVSVIAVDRDAGSVEVQGINEISCRSCS